MHIKNHFGEVLSYHLWEQILKTNINTTKFLSFIISESHSVMSDSLWLHELYSPWNSPGQNTGMGSRSLLQGIFPTQGSNPGLQHCRQILYQLSRQGSPKCILSVLRGMWDLSSLSRYWTWPPALEAQSLNHWTAREDNNPYSEGKTWVNIWIPKRWKTHNRHICK